nr:hypothetical protein CTI12_AA044460 [Tanacetum cinerariifolium]
TDEAKPGKVEEVLEVVTAAKLMTEVVTTATPITTATQVPKASAPRKRRGVVIQDPEETPTASVIEHSEVQSKDKGKGILIEEPKPLKVQALIDMDEEFARYKRKGDSLEQKIAKKQRMDEEAYEIKRHLQIVPNDDDDVYTEATPLASKVPAVDYQIHHENNKPYYKIIRAVGTHKLFLSFITLLKNFNREDLETLWKLVKESFESTVPKNFSNDFLINTLKIIFGKPNVKANVWRDQKGIYGLAKIPNRLLVHKQSFSPSGFGFIQGKPFATNAIFPPNCSSMMISMKLLVLDKGTHLWKAMIPNIVSYLFSHLIAKEADVGMNMWNCSMHKGITATGVGIRGKVKLLVALKNPPALLMGLLNGEDPKSQTFMENIRRYNYMFAFTWMTGKQDTTVNKGRGPFCFRISGKNNHVIRDLLPKVGEPPQFGQLYIYDPANEVQTESILRDNESSSSKKDIDLEPMKKIKDMLDKKNPLVKQFRMAGQQIRVGDATVKIRLIGRCDRDGRQHNLPTADEVDALTVEDGYMRDIYLEGITDDTPEDKKRDYTVSKEKRNDQKTVLTL